jgi:hypothetical protein
MGFVARKEAVRSEHRIIAVKREPLGKHDLIWKVALKFILKE